MTISLIFRYNINEMETSPLFRNGQAKYLSKRFKTLQTGNVLIGYWQLSEKFNLVSLGQLNSQQWDAHNVHKCGKFLPLP